MSRTRKRAKRREYDDTNFVPPVEPLFLKKRKPLYEAGDLVLGLAPDYELGDVAPRVGLVIEADIEGHATTPPQHRVMWEDGHFEVNSEDDLAAVAHS